MAAISLASCVSVNLGPKAAERSKGVSLDQPGSPFEPLDETRADGAWQNRRNGNSISYLSTCNDPADPTLETVARELFAGLKDVEQRRWETVPFNGREALSAEVSGKADGVATRIHAVIFKRNDCLYTITYIGVPKSFEEDRPRFDAFLRSFQAP